MQASVGGTRGMQKPLYRSSIRNNAYQKCLHQLEQSIFTFLFYDKEYYV